MNNENPIANDVTAVPSMSNQAGSDSGNSSSAFVSPEAYMAELAVPQTPPPAAAKPAGTAAHVPSAPVVVASGHHTKLEVPGAFAQLGLEMPLLRALAEIKFIDPSEIQLKMIPVALEGRDVLGQARTGTGKTAAFGLPIAQKLNINEPFQAIVVVPTRELAVQVEAELVRFTKHKPIRLACVYGGTKVSGNVKAMQRNPHIIVGTPGRILDLMNRNLLPLDNIKFVVCDEVDRMFDIGFREDIRKILSACTAPHQTFFVSATIDDDIERMVRQFMRNPERIFTRVGTETLTCPDAQQFFAGVNAWDKQRALRLMLHHEKPSLAIIFCRTKRTVDKVAAGLESDGINASPIHGDLIQNKRERVMRGFRTGKISVLVATDLASRGIDVHEITHVINYDIPEDPEAYVHRVGRTARMGAKGRAITFVSQGQAQLQTEIEKLTNQLLEEYKIPGFTPSKEPGKRFGHSGGGDSAGGAPHGQDQAGAETPEAPAKPQAEDGYVPTSFSNVQPTQSVRPLSGRFPRRRRH